MCVMENSERSAHITSLDVRAHLLAGHVIPAHPLALTPSRTVDERSQRALTRYYIASGAGGMAVGVHTTGFAIHDAGIGLYEPVLALAAETARNALQHSERNFVRVAGLIGHTAQALREADIATTLGYHCGLLSLGAWRSATDADILTHCREVATAIPLFGFYLQPAVGGRVLGYNFWRDFAEIPGVVAIKVAPFNRYATLDVVRALLDSGRRDVALYTGNDDAIVSDLLTDIHADSGVGGNKNSAHFVGGLLGQWAVWTSVAVKLLRQIQTWRGTGAPYLPKAWLSYGASLTEANAAVFDAANAFAGCIPGILHVLKAQGLVQTELTFDEQEVLTAGQSKLIRSVRERHPELCDDTFVAEHVDKWRS
jgi:dihydrodipicolinate synthase/N-acetylneuraminate lyase